MKKAKTGLPY
uniref:Uncharacterized protein n=1 Tax=Rhizophora mucronata TaxID=61149 RepID=A0A2P2R4Z2_RHIMU